METVRVASSARGGSVEKVPRLCAATAVADGTLKRGPSGDADRKDDSALDEIAADDLGAPLLSSNIFLALILKVLKVLFFLFMSESFIL